MKNLALGIAFTSLWLLVGCGAPAEQEAALPSGFTLENGTLYFEGDIIIEQNVGGDSGPGTKLQSAGVFDQSKRYQAPGEGAPWPKGLVSWRFHSSVDTARQTAFRDAIAHYEENTSLAFQEVSSSFAGDYILVRADDFAACNSWVGRQGGAQDMNIGRTKDHTSTGRLTCRYGSILHELGHAVGLIHEQSRPDRDDFVTVGDNSNPGNCDIQSRTTALSHYDLGSIMQYGPNNCGGITPVDGSSFSENRSALGPMDIQGIQIMYGQEFDKTVTTVRRAANVTDVFVHGATNGYVWWRTKTGDSWSDFESLGGPNGDHILGHAEATSWSSSRLDVFVRGLDGALYRKSYDGSSWSPSKTGWTVVPGTGTLASSPTAISWGADRLDVFYKRPDLQLGHTYSTNKGSTWTTEILAGNILGRPRVVSWGSGRLDVFALGTDQRVYHKAFGGGAWSPSLTDWNDLGGNVVGTISAVTWGPDRLDIFVRGGDSRLYHKAWAGGWSPSQTDWNDLGGWLNSNPEVTTWGADRLDIVYQGRDGDARWKRWTSAGWLPSQTTDSSLGGLIVGTPSLTNGGADKLDIFVRGMNDALFHATMNNTSSKWSGFNSRGGVLGW